MLTVVLTAAFILIVPPPPVPVMETQVALTVERRALSGGVLARRPDTPTPGDWWWREIPVDRPARAELPRDAARGPPLTHRMRLTLRAPPDMGSGLAHEASQAP